MQKLTTMNRFIIVLGGLLTVLFCLLSIALVSSIWLNSSKTFLDGAVCPPPCWHNITPVITDESHAFSIISNPSLINQESISISSRQVSPYPIEVWRFESADASNPFWSQHNQLYVADGKVYRIDLSMDFSFDMEEAIEMFGEPSFVYAGRRGEHPVCYYAHIFFLNQGVWIETSECRVGKPWGIFAHSRIESIAYIEKGNDLETVLNQALQPREEDVQVIVAGSRSWKGYGLYEGSHPEPLIWPW